MGTSPENKWLRVALQSYVYVYYIDTVNPQEPPSPLRLGSRIRAVSYAARSKFYSYASDAAISRACRAYGNASLKGYIEGCKKGSVGVLES